MPARSARKDVIATLTRKLAAAAALPTADLALVAVVWAMLGAASLRIAVVPSPRLLRRLGVNGGAVTRASAIGPRQRARAARIARAIAIAARHAPFRADCLPQALVAAQWCRWLAIPHAVQLGARVAAPGGDGAGRLEGHAWVSSGALTVCGGADSAHRFGTVACFVHVPRAARRHAAG